MKETVRWPSGCTETPRVESSLPISLTLWLWRHLRFWKSCFPFELLRRDSGFYFLGILVHSLRLEGGVQDTAAERQHNISCCNSCCFMQCACFKGRGQRSPSSNAADTPVIMTRLLSIEIVPSRVGARKVVILELRGHRSCFRASREFCHQRAAFLLGCLKSLHMPLCLSS